MEIGLLIMYADWQVFAFVFALGFVPLVVNLIWLLLPFGMKRSAVMSNKCSLAFYVL